MNMINSGSDITSIKIILPLSFLDTLFKPHTVYVEVRTTPNIQLNSCLDVKIRSEIKPEMAPRGKGKCL